MKTRTIICCALSLLCSMAANADNWMARLSDEALLTTLSIPGSHDTGTGNGFAPEWQHFNGRYNQTQDLSLGEQWQVGVRAFDLRPALVNDAEGRHLHIHHGVMKTNLSFEHALRQLIDSVTVNPTEFAIVVFQQEGDGDNRTPDWKPAMRDFLNRDEIKSHVCPYRPDLRVSDLRGKILLLARTHYDDLPVGGFVHDWTSEDDFIEQQSATITGKDCKGRLFVQDYYDTIGEKMKVKLFNLNRMFAKSQETAEPLPPLVINHTSAYSELVIIDGRELATSNGYRYNATRTNRAALTYLKKHRGTTGLVMMDYAGIDTSDNYKVRGLSLVRAVIAQNFRH